MAETTPPWTLVDNGRRLVDDRPLAVRLADETEIGYTVFAAMIDRKPQSMRSALMRRYKRERATGKARLSDIIAPAGYKGQWPRREPFWRYGDALRWSMLTDKLQRDGLTPIPYRGSHKKRNDDEAPEAIGVDTGERQQAA